MCKKCDVMDKGKKCSGARAGIPQQLRGIIFFFNDTATTEIYTLSLHDALPISLGVRKRRAPRGVFIRRSIHHVSRSEEHTSELQSQSNLVCRLLLEKKKNVLPYAEENLLHIFRASRVRKCVSVKNVFVRTRDAH